jgi:hypothetical protein
MQAENATGPELEEVVLLVVPMCVVVLTCATFALDEPAQAEAKNESPTPAASPSTRFDVSTARAAAMSSPSQLTDLCV